MQGVIKSIRRRQFKQGMRSFVFIPPVASGGTKVLVSIVRQLSELGFEVYAVARDIGAANEALADLPQVSFDSLRLHPDDLWLVPEGWPNALAPGLRAGARSVLYCQNWAYLFSALPEKVQLPRLKVSILSVSQPVAWFVKMTTGLESPVLRPGIDLKVFRPMERQIPAQVINVAYMPRKNKMIAKGIKDCFRARQGLQVGPLVNFTPIEGLDQDGVARHLQRSHVFLACGFPEGCALPPLEAMACGCLTVGCGGMGSWDYMRQAWDHPFRPWWPERPAVETPWGGNGFWTADADIMAGTLALERAVELCGMGGVAYERLIKAGFSTAAHYSLDEQKKTLAGLWARAVNGEIFNPDHL